MEILTLEFWATMEGLNEHHGDTTADAREVLRARIVLAAAQGEENKQIAERLGVAPNTA